MNRTTCLAIVFLVLAGCADPGPRPPSVTELTTMLESNDPKVQIEAASWIKDLGPRAKETGRALIAALQSPDPTVRQYAASALGRLGPDGAATAVPVLAKALQDPEINVRRAAADSLGQFGPAASSAIPALEEFCKTPDACQPGPIALKKIRP